MNMHSISKLITGILVAGVALIADADAETRPNIVVILTDDQGYGDLGCFGGTHVETPRIDQLAAEGAKLTSFYVAGSVCTPSRAALMTGCYPKRIGLAQGVFLAGDKNGLHPNEITIAELLKSAGYTTGMFGKWHLGDQRAFLPTQQGFDEFFGLPYSHDIHPFHTNDRKHKFPPLPLMEMETVIEEEPEADHLTRRITERAVDFIQRQRNELFFLYVPHPIPHRPIHISPSFMKDVHNSIREKLKAEQGVDYYTRDKIYNHAIAEIDWSVGQILDALETNGIDDNTLVIFSSDNGPRLGKSLPLRGGKGSYLEGGQRVPTVIRWPDKIPAGQSIDELMTAMDLLPTFAAVAGAQTPSDRVIDGKNVLPVLSDKQPSPHEAFFYYSRNRLLAVRSGKWKLHLAAGKTGAEGKSGNRGVFAAGALYDLNEDLAEKNNRVKQYPEVAKKLRSLAQKFEKELKGSTRPAGLVSNAKPLTKRDN